MAVWPGKAQAPICPSGGTGRCWLSRSGQIISTWVVLKGCSSHRTRASDGRNSGSANCAWFVASRSEQITCLLAAAKVFTGSRVLTTWIQYSVPGLSQAIRIDRASQELEEQAAEAIARWVGKLSCVIAILVACGSANPSLLQISVPWNGCQASSGRLGLGRIAVRQMLPAGCAAWEELRRLNETFVILGVMSFCRKCDAVDYAKNCVGCARVATLQCTRIVRSG